jgi:predicted transcriptional regulator
MKVNKEILEIVDVNSNFGKIICCSLYLNAKSKKNEISATVHEQVALLTLKGNDIPSTAKKTGFDEKTVRDSLSDIAAMCGAKE